MLLLSLGSLTLLKAQDSFEGMASYYADKFIGRKTANGDIYSHNELTCAHRTLPFGTKLKVTNPANNVSLILTVNDRGPFTGNRVLDVSKSAAQLLGMISKGVIRLKVEIIDQGEAEDDGFNTTELLEKDRDTDEC
jgi:rare lipoprotein A